MGRPIRSSDAYYIYFIKFYYYDLLQRRHYDYRDMQEHIEISFIRRCIRRLIFHFLLHCVRERMIFTARIVKLLIAQGSADKELHC